MRLGVRRRIMVAMLAGALCTATALADLPPDVARKLDGRLLGAVLAADPEPRPVWVTFTDKGEHGPSDLAARLAVAEAVLSPRARARRDRAGVDPVVDYRDLPVHGPYLERLHNLGLTPYGVSRWFNWTAVRADGEQLVRLAAIPSVARIEPVLLARRTTVFPADPERLVPSRPPGDNEPEGAGIDYGQTLGQLAQIGVPAVHDSGYVGGGVLICVLDEGFNYIHKHEALRDLSIPPGRQRDFVQGDGNVQDTTALAGYSHGTWTLSMIAGNRPGVYVGAAYGAEFAVGRTENSFSETPVEMVFWGMGAEWADSLGADIVSSSVGYFDFDGSGNDYTYQDMNGHTTVVSRAAQIAASKGILVVNSVGNEGSGPWHYLIAPSDVHGDSMIAVGAVDAGGTVAGFSSFGPSADGRIKPDLAARGVGAAIASASGNPNAYSTSNGTSFSCPLVAGLAACLMQARPAWTPARVIRALRQTASRATQPDVRVGYGIPNGLSALSWDSTAGVPVGGRGFIGLALIGPNPLRSDGAPVQIRFAIGEAGPATSAARVRVMDAQGRVVADLWSGELRRDAWTTVSWNGLGSKGRRVGSGLYFITAEAGGERISARIVSLR
ncbi:MAG TPA: S8 family serine peptidase [Candidatus Limnocylindria bacterium]|nr:S8 family serine peptidase [Candidatus Limnocylindria bacterium]